MRICFVALNAYPTLAGEGEIRVGGAEVQQCLIGKHLARRGHQVSFITRDHGQPDAVTIDGITVHKTYRQEDGIRYLRFFHPRITSIWRALRRADADVYYQRCAGMTTGLLALFCRRHGRKFVFASASDADLDPHRVIITNARDYQFFNYGLRKADAVVTQTQTQLRLLRDNYGRDGEVIPNAWLEPDLGEDCGLPPGYVLWVSTLRSWKRPGLFVDLAERMPGTRFVMVGGPAVGKAEEAVYEEIERRARRLPNFHLEGFVPFPRVGGYFNGARVVVNTSEPSEGFPNAFLQAWRRGIPVLTYFDPDDIVKRFRLGAVVTGADEMPAALASLLNDEQARLEMQANIAAYFNAHHDMAMIGPRYERLFSDLAGKTG